LRFRGSVLIADVIHSSRKGRLRDLLGDKLEAASRTHERAKLIRAPYAVTAGDEFQVVPASIEAIPELILDLRRRMRPLGLRIGVGIGFIEGPIRKPVNRLLGEAFARARHAIDEAKSGAIHKYPTLTAFRTPRESFDHVVNLVYGLNDTLLRNMTDTQWRTLEAYTQKQSVDRAARMLRLNISTASRNLQRAHYWQLAEVASTMKEFFRTTWG
jgi:SatD family (SatD)